MCPSPYSEDMNYRVKQQLHKAAIRPKKPYSYNPSL